MTALTLTAVVQALAVACRLGRESPPSAWAKGVDADAHAVLYINAVPSGAALGATWKVLWINICKIDCSH